jgi:hypothetical protein
MRLSLYAGTYNFMASKLTVKEVKRAIKEKQILSAGAKIDRTGLGRKTKKNFW